MQWKVCLSDLDYGKHEQEAVEAVLKSKWLTMGATVARFEERFATFLGVRHAILVNSGTAALHLANRALGIGKDDEVIVPSLTFVATANASLYCGANPVFADITSLDDLNISAADIRRRITNRTRAITVVHFGGYMADMDAICRIADEHNLVIIEDAAHAPGASLRGKTAGTVGNVGCFSFFSNKNLPTGEGGAVVTNDDSIAEEIRGMRSHGMTSLTYERHEGHAYSYDVTALGYNYRPTEITAALALVQLEKLEHNNQRRRTLVDVYRHHLSRNERLQIPFAGHTGVSACHLMPILVPVRCDRTAVIDRLREQGIQTSIHYPPIHQFQWYRQCFGSAALRTTEDVAARELTLPLHPGLDEQDVRVVCTAINEALEVIR